MSRAKVSVPVGVFPNCLPCLYEAQGYWCRFAQVPGLIWILGLLMGGPTELGEGLGAGCPC